jgi:hypothetical protein
MSIAVGISEQVISSQAIMEDIVSRTVDSKCFFRTVDDNHYMVVVDVGWCIAYIIADDLVSAVKKFIAERQ